MSNNKDESPTFIEAVSGSGPDCDSFQEAMKEEHASLAYIETYATVVE